MRRTDCIAVGNGRNESHRDVGANLVFARDAPH